MLAAVNGSYFGSSYVSLSISVNFVSILADSMALWSWNVIFSRSPMFNARLSITYLDSAACPAFNGWIPAL